MNADQFLHNVHVATPCSVDWNTMTGDDRRRFCGKCRKHVYNFSALTSEEAADLVRDTEGRVCGRLFIRQDGRVMTSDCAKTVTPSLAMTWLKRAVLGTVAFGFSAFALLASVRMPNDNAPLPRLNLPLPKSVEKNVVKLHQWIFPKQPTPIVPVPPPTPFAVMGEVSCVPPPTPPTQLPPSKR